MPTNSTVSKALTKKEILSKWERDTPPTHGVEFNTWVSEAALEFDVREDFVRQCLWESYQAFLFATESSMRPEAQRQADFIGASVQMALQTLRDGMTATKKRPVVVNGAVEIVEVDDWPTRLVAADKTIKIHGAYAPEKTEVTSHSLNINVSLSEMMEESKLLEREIKRIESVRARAAAAQGRVELIDASATGPERPLLLDDPLHKDGG